MSEEVTYADLKFQDFPRTDNTQPLGRFGKPAAPVLSRGWRQAALILVLLCLLLFFGLLILAIVFHSTLKAEKGRVNELQNIQEELQKNLSVQLVNNWNSSEQIRNLSAVLQKIATQLCRELYRKNPAHKCQPCPQSWIWHSDNCYLLNDYQLTWQESEKVCSAQNASLLKIRSRSELEFIKSKPLYDYWLGLSPGKFQKSVEKVGDTIASSAWDIRNTSNLNKMYCGFIYNTYVYYIQCSNTRKTVCQKMARPSLNIESILTNGIPGGSSKF
ncbi:C-type lectin domain family 12 member A isoform X2 [Ochotona curzoniae]|uniref:C-type lectin domain family 12 member A isoform X2 n=1 Tax=Ochotona curzoniae TaxID=130825 RepID=UPI001B353947|nr:C-type lectin domain family 12 member A isoform X2 [Ochotona curzoniae]